MRKKNADIELMRFLMITAVAVLHFGEDYTGISRTLRGGYLGVDYFFLIGGFFLAAHVKKEQEMGMAHDTAEYMRGRLKRLYAPYISSILVLVGIRFIENGCSFRWLAQHFYATKWQYVFLHFLGAATEFEMRSIWYLSVYVFLMYVVYFFLTYNEKFYVGICPAAAILILVHIYASYGSLSMQGVYEGWLSGGVLRGFAEMSAGVYLYVQNYAGGGKNCQGKELRLVKLAVSVLKGIVLFSIFYLMHTYGFDENDFFILFLFVLYIRLALLDECRYGSGMVEKMILWLGSLNYWMFLLHLPVSYVIVKLLPGKEYRWMLLLYLAAVIAVSACAQLLEMRLRHNWKHKTMERKL